MAQIPLSPSTISVTVFQGIDAYAKTGVIKDFTGAALDLSGWFEFQGKCYPSQGGPCTADVTLSVNPTGNADGTINVHVASTADFDIISSGSCRLVILGSHVSGDTAQIMASGTLNFVAGQ